MNNKLHYTGLLAVMAVFAMQPLSAQQLPNPAQNLPLQPTPPDTPQQVYYPGIGSIIHNGKGNYVKTFIPDKAIPTLIGSSIPFRQTTVYLDGLGRPLQTVAKKAYEDGYDIINHVVYDDNTGAETYQYLPFPVRTTQSDGKLEGVPQSGLRIFYDQAGPDEQPYSKTETDGSPLNRVLKQMPPGRSWVGSGKGTVYSYLTNTVADGVRVFTIGSGPGDLPQTSGTYAPGTLSVLKTTDEDGKYTLEYKDRMGRLILKKNWINGTTGHNGFACTYYVYDNLDRLRYVIPPQAVATISSTWNLSGVTELCYRYGYDAKGRTKEKKIPGKEVEYMIYDKRDRLVFYQDGKLRADNGKWAFTLYDALDRTIATGIQLKAYGDMQLDKDNLQQTMDVGTIANGFIFQYCNDYALYNSYPPETGLGYEVKTYTYYDNYDQLSSLPFDPNPFPGIAISSNPIDLSQFSSQTRSLATGTRVKVKDPESGNERWLSSVNYYDEQGRVMQTRSQNYKGGIETSSNTYYFQGQLGKNLLQHENPDAKALPGVAGGPPTNIKILTTNTYDFQVGGGRASLTNVTQKFNDGALDYPLANFYYDHLGRVVVKQTPAANMLQEYTLRGFLNHIDVRNTNNDPDSVHLFEENLYYDKGFGSRLYNGNIAGITWRMAGSAADTQAYGYSYDNLNRLTHAQYGRKSPGSWQWPTTSYDYTVSGIDYDLNGNIQHMNQRGVPFPGISAPIAMDQLTYAYAPGSNQLISVQDAIPASATTPLPDFKNNANAATEYTYDANGNMLTDANKGINTAIAYSQLNKPEIILMGGTNEGKIVNIYDALGNRLQKRTKAKNSNQTDVFDYIGNFVYKNDTLQYVLNSEGRARPVANSSNELKFTFDYFVKDHLGNVRSTLNAEPSDETYLARHEISLAGVEQLVFDNIPTVRDTKPGSTDPEDRMAARLNGSDKRIGTAIMLKTMPGDRFVIRTDAFSEDGFKDNGSAQPEALVESLASVLLGGNTYSGVPIAELPDNVRTIKAALYNPALVGELAQLSLNDDPTRPKAHLNVLQFNSKFELVRGGSAVTQVPWDGMGGWTTFAPVMPAGTVGTEVGVVSADAGYIIVFVDNQSLGKDVWFDNIMIEHYAGKVMEENHYYPFGLTLNLDSRPGHKDQPYKFQKQSHENDFGLNIYSFKYREHDPQIGRFWQVDPLATDYVHNSVYAFSENKVTGHIELEGLEAVNSNSPYIRSAVQQHGDVDAFQKNARQAFRLSATVGPRIEGGIKLGSMQLNNAAGASANIELNPMEASLKVSAGGSSELSNGTAKQSLVESSLGSVEYTLPWQTGKVTKQANKPGDDFMTSSSLEKKGASVNGEGDIEWSGTVGALTVTIAGNPLSAVRAVAEGLNAAKSYIMGMVNSMTSKDDKVPDNAKKELNKIMNNTDEIN